MARSPVRQLPEVVRELAGSRRGRSCGPYDPYDPYDPCGQRGP
ncbi:hypothetical protein AAHZ94_03660 [Streptomyces sp. HSW2009]